MLKKKKKEKKKEKNWDNVLLINHWNGPDFKKKPPTFVWNVSYS